MIELRRRYSGSKGSDSPSFSRLPAGYQEVEYLESSKDFKEYLLINIFNKVGDVVEFTAQLMELVGGRTFFGAVDDVGDYRFGLGATATNYVLSVNNNSKILNSKITYTKIPHKLEWKEDYFNFYIDNTLVTQEPNKQLYTELANQMPIFAAYYRKAYVEHIWMRLFSFKVYREGHLHIDLVPCYRTSDRVAGMYDIVNDVFYTNAGTGEFLVGADVSGGDVDIEYLPSINVTGGSMLTTWIPKAGAIVKWDVLLKDNALSSNTEYYKKPTFFRTEPYDNEYGLSFASNSGSGAVHQVWQLFSWLQLSYNFGGTASTYDIPPQHRNGRFVFIWDSLNGLFGIDGIGNLSTTTKKTSSSGFPLRLFAEGEAQIRIIYRIELINQDGDNMTLRPAKKEGVVGFVCEETGEFMSSDNGVEFTIYQEES